MIKKIVVSIATIVVVIAVSSVSFSVSADSLTGAKVTISDSRAGHPTTSHVFNFTTSTAGIISSIVFQYCKTPTGSCEIPNGITTTSAIQGAVNNLGASSSNFATNGTIILTVLSPALINTGVNITVPFANITNPTSINSSFFVRITTQDSSSSPINTSIVAFATLTPNSLAVTAAVESMFQISVLPVTSGSVNGTPINVDTTTTTTIPFGSLSAGTKKIAAHDIVITANASHGYLVTVRSDNPPLTDGSNHIDSFTGTNSSPTPWTSPTGATPNVNTGFVGYTTEDNTLCTGVANRFTGNNWAGLDTTTHEIVCNVGSSTSSETVRIGWQIEINNVQPVGSYAGVFILVTTPTY